MIAVYKIISPSGQVYVGQTRNMKVRQGSYNAMNCKHQIKLYNSFKKYGVKNHVHEIEISFNYDVAQHELNLWECFFINLYKGFGFKMMNIRNGGANGKMSEETKRKISVSNKGKQNTLGKKLTEDHKLKIRLASIGKNLGKTHSEETRKVISMKNKISMIGVNKGIKRTPEVVEKMRERALLQFSKNKTA